MPTIVEEIPEYTMATIQDAIQNKMGRSEITELSVDWVRSLSPLQRLKFMCISLFDDKEFAETLLQIVKDSGFMIGVPKIHHEIIQS